MDKRAQNAHKMSTFQWTEEKSAVAILLAEGHTHKYIANEIKKNEKTLRRWLMDIEFSAEVDRLSLMTGIASRAERLRIIKKIVRQKTLNELIDTEKDVLDWLKFAQSETDGIKLDLAALSAAFGDDETSLA